MSITIEMLDSYPGSYMPETKWLLYAENVPAPLCRKPGGSYMAEDDSKLAPAVVRCVARTASTRIGPTLVMGVRSENAINARLTARPTLRVPARSGAVSALRGGFIWLQYLTIIDRFVCLEPLLYVAFGIARARRWRSSDKKRRIQMAAHGIIAWLVIGAIAGWLAGLIVGGGGFGLLGDIVVGIVGAFAGGWLAGVLGVHIGGGFIASIITATAGAVVLLVLWKLIRRA
jgi:uncharacterized membrane protein YeaQ/YmgE (transglycosylase-associated protein family)